MILHESSSPYLRLFPSLGSTQKLNNLSTWNKRTPSLDFPMLLCQSSKELPSLVVFQIGLGKVVSPTLVEDGNNLLCAVLYVGIKLYTKSLCVKVQNVVVMSLDNNVEIVFDVT